MKRIFFWIGVLLFLGMLAGCGPKLQAVRDFSTASTATMSGMKAVIKDFAPACEREVRLSNDGEFVYTLERLTTAKCQDHRIAQKAYLEVADLLSEFFIGLGSLAADNPADYQGQLTALQVQLTSATYNDKPLFGQEKVKSALSLARILLDFTSAYYRRSEIDKLINESYNKVDSLLDILSTSFSNNYITVLEAEEIQLEDKFKIQPQKLFKDEDTEENNELYSVFLVGINETYSKKLEPINQKRAALQAALGSISECRELLKTLYENTGKLDIDEIETLVKLYVEQVKPAIKAIQDAY